MYSSYGGMLPSPLEEVGDRCKGLTKELKPCKKRACCDSFYCTVHKELYRYDKPRDCVICSETLGATCRPTNCGHVMHKGCLDQWLLSNSTCPVCRSLLKPNGVSLESIEGLQGFLQELAVAVNVR